MSSIPSLYLKWRVFRALVGDARSDAEIARTVFHDDDGPVKFTKLLYGDYGCRPEIATEFIDVINRCVVAQRNAHGLPPDPAKALNTSDLARSTCAFAQRLIDAAESVSAGRCEDAHGHLVSELLPAIRNDESQSMTIERFSLDRSFPALLPDDGPVVFMPDRHSGQFSIQGIRQSPVATYVFVVRDTMSAGRFFWEQRWADNVLWLPSPFAPEQKGDTLLLMPGPQPVLAMPGRFVATAVVVFDGAAVESLDPSGLTSAPRRLDEDETARFVTRVRRLAKRMPQSVSVLRGEYIVEDASADTACHDQPL
ncbi:MAG: hypothetical protein AAGC70_11605 [Pseudomonadota bacterium]